MNKFSSYLKKKKPLAKEIVEKLSKDFSFVSVLGTDVKGKNYSVSGPITGISPSSITECGFVIRVYNEGVYSEYSFNELEKNKIDDIVIEVKSLANTKSSVDIVNCNKIIEESLSKKFKRNQKGDILNDEEIINKLKAEQEYAKSLNDKIINVGLAYENVEISKMYISNEKDLEQYYTWINPRVNIVVKDGNNIKYAYDGFGSNDSNECFNKLHKMVKDCADLAIELLNSELPVPGKYTIIADPSITGLIAHEAFGHGLEMDMFVKERAKSVEYMNKYVASKKVSMHDGAKSAFSAASYFFDDEGALASDTKIIDKGVLIGGICDSVSASILNYHPTGNGRRESYKRKAYTRMTNTFFEKGKYTLDEMIKSVDYGYYISTTNNGMEDPKNWGIQCTALYGREIKEGKFTGKIISPVVMSGYVIDLLESISMVSKDNFEVIGSGSCGKGYKEWVRVSDGGASIKAEVRIG